MIAKLHAGKLTMGSSATTADAALPESFDLTRSFVLAGFQLTHSLKLYDNFVRVELADANTLRLIRDTGSSNLPAVTYTVVELTGGSVQYVSAAMGGAAAVDIACTAVDPARSFALPAGCVSTYVFDRSNNAVNDFPWQARLIDGTTARCESRFGAAVERTAYAWVVETE